MFYSGDFATFSQRTIEGARIPKLRPDVAIVESTYGNRLHANRQVEEKRLVELVKDINTMYYRNPLYLRNALAKRILKGNEPFYSDEIQPVAQNANRED